MSNARRLHELLDERGIGWRSASPNMTRWEHDGMTYTAGSAWPYAEGMLALYGLTPEQAVEATLGQGACKDVGEGMFECSECGCSIDLEDVASCEPTMWVDGVASVPRFCPNCGRAVARDA